MSAEPSTASTGPAAATAVRTRLRRVRWLRILGFWLIAAIAAIPVLFPLWWMVTSSLKSAAEVFAFPPTFWPTDPRWSNYVEVFRLGPFARQLFNSTYISLLNIAGILLVASLAGYAFARLRFRGRNAIFVGLLTALFMPAEVTIIPLFRLMSRLGWVNTHLPLIIEPWFGPFSVLAIFIMRQSFLALPDDLEDAARIDGLGRFGIFWRIGLPLMKPSLATVAVLGFLNTWNRFLEPLVYIPSIERFTVPLALTQYVTTEGGPVWEVQLAAATISMLPALVLFLLVQRYFIEGIATAGLKG